ncbi:NAD(P)H-dependent glycerol-3-phosphate dehydrogenase [Thetidibacter halocola]|uniref:Glycerol-3-phosphate dehydrogenase [NAD(P)+] n=1 Tax=Thetidibacter halocola TaxID=2827239 RepID=A0A8J7WET8_9RHOB|nr:NAD(P)H-dependent glycerol-3-phosphate dehydrogenase [Thetidibacter halocola]MBS0123778.1 NAD(P)-dependent glycerol-3-phosphate dehydrogenase [Thetidibacter halocola]
MSVAILGGGAFGTALAVALSANGPVTLWAREAAPLIATRQSPRLPGVTLPETVTVTGDLAQAVSAETILLSVPMQSLSGLLAQIDDPLTGKALVACCKGIDLATLEGPAALIAHAKPKATAAILTGPSFATDIAHGLPTALTLACASEARGAALQAQLSTATLRLYRSSDVTGAELGGALKNVIAIACGACIGLGLGESARAALMTRGFAEMTRLATRLGARAETLAGLSGFGDLALTCTSDHSRNYRFGRALARGETIDPAVTVEGARTAEAVVALAERLGVDMPIARAVTAIAHDGRPVPQAMQDLLNRPLKEE